MLEMMSPCLPGLAVERHRFDDLAEGTHAPAVGSSGLVNSAAARSARLAAARSGLAGGVAHDFAPCARAFGRRLAV